MDAWWWLLIVLVQVTRGSHDFEVTQGSHDVVITFNILRPITQISDKFLGISTSPRQILNDGEYSIATVNMLTALSPGYLRVGGPESDNLAFMTLTNTSDTFLLAENQWVNLNQLAVETGLHLIFSLSPKSHGQSQLLSFSDSRGYNITWQLGYCTANNTRTTEKSSKVLGQEVSNLRRLIDSFPRYQNTAILSPDLEFCEDPKCLEAHKDLFLQANDAIDVVVLQMKPQGAVKDTNIMFEKLDKLSGEIEKSSFNRDFVLQKTKNASLKKNFWVAEAENAAGSGGMSETMSCALSLGLSSRLGYSTFLLHLGQLSQPSPSYWAALLWRALVGRAVLGARVWPQEGEVAVFAACTEAEPQPTLDTEWEYDAGAVTLWGVNTAEESTRLALRTSSLLDHIHLYMLTGDDRNSGNILLNGRPLRMVHGVLPRLSPRIRKMSRSMSVTVPPQSVFFIVLPDVQTPACLIKAGEKLTYPLKKEDGPPLVLNIPILTSKAPSLAGKLGMKPSAIFFEKGGIFTDAIVKKNGLANGVITEANKNVQGRTEAIEDYGEKYIEAKLEEGERSLNEKEDLHKMRDLSGSYIVQNISPLNNNNEKNPPKLSSKHFSENSKKYEQKKFTIRNSNEYSTTSEKINEINKSHLLSNGSSVTSNANITKENHTLETEVPRVKRSEDYSYYEQTRIRDPETSPLYRRVNLLRRILNKMQQPTQYEDEEQNKYFHDFTGRVETLHGINKKNSWNVGEKNSDYPIEISPRKTNHIVQEQTPRVLRNKNVENINYLPGEFYNILGGLKLDSNISLKDKEEIIEATNSLQKQPEIKKCNNNESKLIVTKKPQNDPQEDRRLVEHATENIRQYYMQRNNTAEHQVKTEKVADYEIKGLDNKGDELPETISNEDLSVNNEEPKLHIGKFFQDLKKEENVDDSIQIKLATKRTKREESLDQYLKLSPHNEEDYKKPDYSDELELRRFLEELTNEGEELLQTIDKEYESSIGNSSQEIDTKQFLTTESVPALDKDKTSFGDEKFFAKNKTDEADFYLKNNILIDKEVKPKRNYPSLDEHTVHYAVLNKSSKTNNNLEIENEFSTSVGPVFESITSQTDSLSSSDELSKPKELTTSGNLNYTKTKLPGKSITEVVNNSDTFIESVIPQTDKSTKTGINTTSNTKLESASNLLYNHTENTNTGYIANNFSSVSEISKEITKVPTKIESNSLTGSKTEKHQSKVEPDGKAESSLTMEMSSPITVTEKIYDSEKILDNKTTNIGNILNSPLKPNNIYIKNLEETTDLGQQQTKPVAISKSMITLNISDIVNTTTENISDKKRKIDSESKLQNTILLPPLKPTLILRPFSVPSILSLNRNLSLPKKIDVINNRITELNNKHNLSAPVLETDKYKEKLEAIKQRLQKARERLLNLTIPRTTQLVLPYKPLKPKREVTMNRGMINNLFKEVKESKAETQSQKNQPEFDATTIKRSLFKFPSSENLYLIHRLKRQVYNDNERETSSSMENNPDQPGNVETEADTKRQPFANIITPYYFSAIKKWVIPLSNRTENILYNSKLFPVNLYGIVSDKWVQENVERSSDSEARRQRRALRYPCIEDKFNDFEAEGEKNKFPWSSNVENGKVSSLRSTKAHSLTNPGKTIHGIIFPQLHSTRSRRAINQDIQMNEMEIKALLTNEIVKEKPTNDESDHENVFSSMLHKTLSKTMTNKTGIERMFELAKQYQKTKPSSLEIFSKKSKQPTEKKFSLKHDDENTAIEITDYDNLDDSSTKSRKNLTDITTLTPRNNFMEETVVKNSSILDSASAENKKNNDNLNRDRKTPEDAWSDFINKIKEFFESVTTVIKKGMV